ncbi:MAG: PKD domain-containing protein [Candidatus Peregrinibacteria bacterium GW2011_GWE2_39_6]|nr:MAG: PKD domain-containing protein [Candidatus Peregrinibacteria bacterium GW2011_GWE2_39_6]
MGGIGLFLAPKVQAEMNIEFDTGLEEALCDGLEGSDLLECQQGATTSFTDFQGDFAPPEKDGYASGITQTSSAREFIVNVTNFILSFLGLAAVIVIIYGGFMYVTAGGEQEKADKGKKSITYAVMGIVVVLISYALVNTLIGAASKGGDTNSGLYSSGGVTSQSLDTMQSEQIANQVKKLTENYVQDYTIYVNVMSILTAIGGVPAFDDSGLSDMEEGFNLLLKQVDSFSNITDITNAALQTIRRNLAFSVNDKVKTLTNFDEWLKAEVLLAAQSGDESLSADADEVDPYHIGKELVVDLNDISTTALSEYQDDVVQIKTELIELQGSFMENSEIYKLFDSIIIGFDIYANTAAYSTTTYPFLTSYGQLVVTLHDTPPGGARQVGDLVAQLNDLYNLVKNLQFTTAVITANTTTANAPVTVTFDALNSSDPTNLTILNENYQWDLLGNGFNQGNDDLFGPNVFYTYENPGTYRVGLRVISNDPQNIAAGISYLSIKVNPPSSIIVLEAKTTSGATVNSESNEWTVTGLQAKEGIVFDASATTDGNGVQTTIVNYKFDFGDGDSQDGENPVATHYYTKEGVYKFQLEVTDQNGVTDRKIVTLKVASPAAYLEASKIKGEIGDELAFDASGSVTDNGNINYYEWSIEKGSNVVHTEEGDRLEELNYVFTEPGEYIVRVKVTDSLPQSDDTFLNIVINSTPPVASFTYVLPDPTMPGRVYLDASKSYDPDKGDTISYLWTINGEEGKDYEFVENTSVSSKKAVVDFKNKGDYKVLLTVNDQYEEPLKQSTDYEKELTVNSVLGLTVETKGQGVSFLSENNEAEVTLQLESEYGTAYEIDWKDATGVQTLAGGSQTVEHIYNQAGTYPVEVMVYDNNNEYNLAIHNVYVGNGTAPIPVIKITLDEAIQSYNEIEIEGNRKGVFKFDASESVDLDGTSLPRKNFSWDLGDGTLATGSEVTHIFKETGQFTVTLTVQSEKDHSLNTNSTVKLNITALAPEIYGLTVKPQGDQLVTPLTVKLEVNADDPDGAIANYKFWYYDVNNSSEKIDTQISLSNVVFMTVNTSGITGESKRYAFGVEVADNENSVSSSDDLLPVSQIPVLEVQNGPNQPPTASLTVDRVNILVGETVNFTSTSSDKDGRVVQYIWDFEGDGFYNNEATTDSSKTYVFEKAAPQGVEVRLKIIDDGAATAVSNPIRIYVDSLTKDPEAAFVYDFKNLTVQFTDNSKADEANGASLAIYQWDFDTSLDSDGNGINDDDVDSVEKNPTRSYEIYGTYKVRLVVIDNEGNTDEVLRSVVLDESDPPEGAFSYTIKDKEVTFKNNSKVNAGTEVTIEVYKWDFDLVKDSDGNGNRSDDQDETGENPVHTYTDYGSHQVKLTITDSLGRSDEVVQTIQLVEPKEEDFEAYLQSNPAADPKDGKIHIKGSSGNITFNYSVKGVVEGVQYCIDKNVYFDSDGNGKTQDDCNHEATSAGNYTTDFSKDWGLVVVQLIVTDANKRTVKVTKEVVFDADQTAVSTSLLPVTNLEAIYILVTALGFAILGSRLYARKEVNDEFDN